MKKKLIGGLLGVCMISSLAGCSDDTETTETSATEATTTATTTAETSIEETTEAATEATTEETAAAETVTAVTIDPADILNGFERFDLTSTDLNDGVWNDVISNTDKGENVSPSLSWEPVDGAALYVIYMIDLDAGYWMHWKADEVTETDLTQGWAQKGYVGPYPPAGTVHTYDIYVVALKAPVERVKGNVNASAPKAPEFLRGLDIDADGNSGNIISYGQLSGTFTND